MNVIACDVCHKTNVENPKPFAMVERGKCVDYSGVRKDQIDAYGFVNIYPAYNGSGIKPSSDTKILCNECTMTVITEYLKQMFSDENYSKLTQSA